MHETRRKGSCSDGGATDPPAAPAAQGADDLERTKEISPEIPKALAKAHIATCGQRDVTEAGRLGAIRNESGLSEGIGIPTARSGRRVWRRECSVVHSMRFNSSTAGVATRVIGARGYERLMVLWQAAGAPATPVLPELVNRG